MRPALKRYPGATPVDPIKFFALGGGSADGAIYNYQDLSTLHQDQIGTAAAVGSPVGMTWSVAHDTTRGTNLTNNGTFTSNTTGWTGASATLSSVSGRCRVTNSGAAAGRAHQSHTTEVGTVYEITVKLKTNANGAALAIGTANSTSNLLLLSYAAGVTSDTIIARFIAQTTTSFVQLRTTSTTSGHFTEWDDVEVRKVPGRHRIQTLASARPILRQDGTYGFYYLENDDGAKAIQGGLSFDVGAGCYAAVACRRNDLANGTAFYAIGKSSVAYLRLGTATSSRYTWTLRDATANAAGSCINNAYPNDRRAVIDALVGTAAYDHAMNRRAAANVVATGFAGNTGSTSVLYGNAALGGVQATGTGGHIGGDCFFNVDPGVDRAGVRAWLANLMLAD